MEWFCPGKYCAMGVLTAVPSQNEISDLSFNLKAATSLGIQLSRGGKETSFGCFFGLENDYQCCYTLKCRPSPSKVFFFTIITLPREKKNLQSSYLMLFCITVKLLCNRWTFCGVSENALSCTSLPWVAVAVLGCCMYSSLVKSMLAFLTPTIHTTLHL